MFDASVGTDLEVGVVEGSGSPAREAEEAAHPEPAGTGSGGGAS